jgi:putative transposase
VVHFYRNVFSHTPNNKVGEVARMLKAIHAQEDGKSALAKNAEVATKLRAMRLSRAADLVTTSGEETLTYFAFPTNNWRQIKTNNRSRGLSERSDVELESLALSRTVRAL